MTLEVVTPPVDEPITLAQAKDHLRVLHDDEDDLITDLVTVSREQAEHICWRALITQTLRYQLDRFPPMIEPPRPPLQSVSSITYVDTAGATQILDASKYQVDTKSMPGRIVPAFGTSWPSTRAVPNAVTVEFIAGYADPNKVPKRIVQAMKMFVGYFYRHRDMAVVGTIIADLPLTPSKMLYGMRPGA